MNLPNIGRIVTFAIGVTFAVYTALLLVEGEIPLAIGVFLLGSVVVALMRSASRWYRGQ